MIVNVVYIGVGMVLMVTVTVVVPTGLTTVFRVTLTAAINNRQALQLETVRIRNRHQLLPISCSHSAVRPFSHSVSLTNYKKQVSVSDKSLHEVDL